MYFTRSFSSVSAISTLLLACGCSYLIPENPSAPRYNTVMGERRVPMLNTQSMTVASADPMSAPVAPVSMAPVFPPVEATVRAQAEQEIASSPLPAPVSAPEMRRVPIENTMSAAPVSSAAPIAPMVLSRNDAPDFSSVPPRPAITGQESTAARLANVRAALERDRAAATTAKTSLARDAAAEPSMLDALPETTGALPPPAAVRMSPAAQPSAPPPAPQSMQLTPPPSSGMIAMPPTPVFAPPPPPMQPAAQQTSAFAPITFAAPTESSAPQIVAAPLPPMTASPTSIYYPPLASAAAPLQLRPPSSEISIANVPPPAFRATPVPRSEPQPLPPAMKEGFDPMAGGRLTTASNQTTLYGGRGYLPDSRYSETR